MTTFTHKADELISRQRGAKKSVSADAIMVAIAWLNCNDGIEGEANHCKAVAEWLEVELKNRMVRNISKKTGCSAQRVREVLFKEAANG